MLSPPFPTQITQPQSHPPSHVNHPDNLHQTAKISLTVITHSSNNIRAKNHLNPPKHSHQIKLGQIVLRKRFSLPRINAVIEEIRQRNVYLQHQ